jgi:hypothetical protein
MVFTPVVEGHLERITYGEDGWASSPRGTLRLAALAGWALATAVVAALRAHRQGLKVGGRVGALVLVKPDDPCRRPRLPQPPATSKSPTRSKGRDEVKLVGGRLSTTVARAYPCS